VKGDKKKILIKRKNQGRNHFMIDVENYYVSRIIQYSYYCNQGNGAVKVNFPDEILISTSN